MKWILKCLIVMALSGLIMIIYVSKDQTRLPENAKQWLLQLRKEYPSEFNELRKLYINLSQQTSGVPVQFNHFDANYWQQHHPRAHWGYDPTGKPATGLYSPLKFHHQTMVTNSRELIAAVKNATAGTDIILRPGTYRFYQKYISTEASGTRTAPIRVRPQTPGTVRLKFNTEEGWLVRHPYWIFKDLIIEGDCDSHGRCDHAFHIVENGDNSVLDSNQIVNFNSAIKINGNSANGRFPDNGLVLNSAIYNLSGRQTSKSVTPIDIVASSGWTISDNYIADFTKLGGNRTSYAGFMKGNGENGIFERNTVLCRATLNHTNPTVGLSFGGGGTGKQYCRDNHCDVEFHRGTLRNNLIMNCTDVGIYINNASETEIYNNTVLKTLGLHIRFPQSQAVVLNNVIEGMVKNRDGASHTAINNQYVSQQDYGPKGELTLAPLDVPGLKIPDNLYDLCLKLIEPPYNVGALQAGSSCFASPKK